MDFPWKEGGQNRPRARQGEARPQSNLYRDDEERREGGEEKESCNIRMPYVLEPKCTSTQGRSSKTT